MATSTRSDLSSNENPASVSDLDPTPAPQPVNVIVITNRSDLMEIVPIQSLVDPSNLGLGFNRDTICSSPGSHCVLKAGWYPDTSFMESRSMLGTYVRAA